MNAAFKKWFGNSKVVDAHGQPLVVYHGTSEKFSTFKDSSDGIYFTDNKEFAANYGSEVIAAYIALRQPRSLPYSWFDSRVPSPQQMRRDGYDGFVVETPYGANMYAVFSASQIKSIDNDGTWDADDPDIRSNPPMTVSRALRSRSREWMFLPDTGELIRGDDRSADLPKASRDWSNGWMVHNHPGGPFFGFSIQDVQFAERYKLRRMDVVYPRHDMVVVAESATGKWWPLMPRSYLEQVAMQNSWKYFLRDQSRSIWKIEFVSVRKEHMDDYEWTRAGHAGDPDIRSNPATPEGKTCPDCEELIRGQWRTGRCDACRGSGRDESDEDCPACQGTGMPVCCRCEGTGIDPYADDPRGWHGNPGAALFLFSYGSNDPRQLAERLGRPIDGARAYLPKHRRVFRGFSQRWGGGVASLARDRSGTVYGYVAPVTEADLDVLDQYEGVRSGKYERKVFKVVLADREVNAVAYVSRSSEFNEPTRKYLEACARTVGEFWRGDGGKVTWRDFEIR